MKAWGGLKKKKKKTKDVDGNWLAEEFEVLNTFLPSSFVKPHALFEFLVVNKRFTALSFFFIYLTMSVTDASSERISFQN